MRIAVGQCYEDMAQPYAPFRSLLTHFEEEELLDDSGTSFLHLLTGHATPASGLSTALDAKPAKFLFMNVTQAVITLASRGPLLFIVEDLHWADPSTLDLFDYLAFSLAEQASVPLLLIGTHRPVEADTRLGKLLERLQPENVARGLELPGLDEVETRHFLMELRVSNPTQQLVQMVHEATQGIPLFIQEAVHHLVRQGTLYEQDGDLSLRTGALPSIELPPDLSNAISGRLQSLPAACQFPLMLAALLGETFDTAMLQMIVSLNPQRLQEAMETGIEHGVLRREDTHFRFAHPLLRHAFYNRLEPVGRRNYHLRIAQTLETRHADHLESHMLEMAYHWV